MRKVETTIQIETDGARIISAFTDPKMLRDWWGVERCLIDKKPVGMYTLAWQISERGIKYVSSGIIRKYDPEHLLIVENFVYLNPEKPFLGPLSLTVRATPKDHYHELYVCQDGYLEGTDWDWYYVAVRNAWPVVFTNPEGVP
jgi:uncharacterized protein YndB with AHSA1/START domain